MPLAGAFLKAEEIERETSYPLRLYLCQVCGLVQILDVLSTDILFQEYFYLSSVTTTLSQHFLRYAQELRARFVKTKNDLVVEIGCNDGVLLAPLQDLGIRAIGVDPASNVVAVAQARGLNVVNAAFTEETARDLLANHGPAKVITASNVFAHIDDLHEVLRGVTFLLATEGTFIVEVHYLGDLLKDLQYDMIYQEHLCYYSLSVLEQFFKGFGLRVFDAELIGSHAGSLRVYATNSGGSPCSTGQRLESLRESESHDGLTRPERLQTFASEVAAQRVRLSTLLLDLKTAGKRLAGYGAPGRGNTLLNYCGIDSSILDFIVDASPLRQGHLTPGTHIPIVSPEALALRMPDYALMLAWSYEKEILPKETVYRNQGGKFIVPLPEIRLV